VEALAGFLPYSQEPTRSILKGLGDLQDTEIEITEGEKEESRKIRD
jgi:hypothetical protein